MIAHYIQKTKQRRNQIRNKYKARDISSLISQKWKTRTLEHEAKNTTGCSKCKQLQPHLEIPKEYTPKRKT